MTDRGKVDALNTDMQMNGVEYAVPTDLLPILHSILQVMYNVSDPTSADESLAATRRGCPRRATAC